MLLQMVGATSNEIFLVLMVFGLSFLALFTADDDQNYVDVFLQPAVPLPTTPTSTTSPD